jgi:mRNA-degrading endonuclease toxin of MazEF toxin-antitoxin module
MATPLRGEIYKIEVLERERRGKEFFGYHWYVIVSRPEVANHFGVVMAVPLTSPENKETGEAKDLGSFRLFRIRIPEDQKNIDPGERGLIGDSLALVHQVRPMDLSRFANVHRSGTIKQQAMNAIEGGLAHALKIPAPSIPPAITMNSIEAAQKKVLAAEQPKPTPGSPVRK